MDPDLLDQLFALYNRTFPANERRSESSLRRSFDTPDYRIITRQENGALIGFAILFAPMNERFALLEYLAVDPAHRGRGIGAELFEEAVTIAANRTLVVETESETADSSTQRRQSFYRRLGCRRIEGLRYQLPFPGNPPAMDLLVRGEQPETAELTHWLRRIYVEVYGCKTDDPRIEQMMRFLSQ